MPARWIASLLLFLGCAFLAAPAQEAPDPIPAWQLVWADEFDQTDGTAPNAARWTYDTGGGGWGNNELETYTSRRQNSFIQDGKLVIEARRETDAGSDGIQRNYTSARLKTLGKASWTYGRIEARIKVSAGQGLWPAFWMLGNNINQVSWPQCGELDIMENIGKEPSTIHGAIHGPGYSAGSGPGRAFVLSGGKRFADDFHLFAVEWESARIRWFVDQQLFFTVTPASLPAGRTWVFDHPQFLLLNVAVGGIWPGSPDANTVFPQRMQVDYVRFYARTNAPAPVLQLKPLPDGAEARWPTLFPMAWIESAPLVNGPWKLQSTTGARSGTEFVAAVPPGYYRLRW